MLFTFTGGDVEDIPGEITLLRVHNSVTAIPAKAFHYRDNLITVVLPDGLLKIGDEAFYACDRLENVVLPEEGLQEIGEYAFWGCKLERMNFPTTLKVIGKVAFCHTNLSSIDLPDGIEDMGEAAFCYCESLSNARIPPLINKLPREMFSYCISLFSIELLEEFNQICSGAFAECHSLRNLAFPPSAEIEENAFYGCNDLLQIFDSSEQIEGALKHRFNGLPIHKLLYYQSYHPMEATLDRLNKEMNLRAGQSRALRSKLNPTGNQQDCLGMTPLHILACSKKQSLELYQLLIDKYPQNLVTKDKWGARPLFYALWGGAPGEIIQFLIDSHKSNYPNNELNWGEMVETLCVAGASLGVLKNLLDVQQTHFPDKKISWDNLLEISARPLKDLSDERPGVEVFRFCIQYSLSDRVRSIGLKQWRADIINMIESIPDKTHDTPTTPAHRRDPANTRKAHLDRIRSKLATYERDFHCLKEATSMLEFAMWSAKMSESTHINPSSSEGSNKKMKVDKSDFRNQCHISCGADNIIENVLPYLLPRSC